MILGAGDVTAPAVRLKGSPDVGAAEGGQVNEIANHFLTVVPVSAADAAVHHVPGKEGEHEVVEKQMVQPVSRRELLP